MSQQVHCFTWVAVFVLAIANGLALPIKRISVGAGWKSVPIEDQLSFIILIILAVSSADDLTPANPDYFLSFSGMLEHFPNNHLTKRRTSSNPDELPL
ncbi:hypothetical protein [Leptolyngbya ohadii]|uniref:hypothetical protein n=1 Tax=Leptolyngbya ohadii TaxID=1962290 RepID=UPI001179F782|nr:hypothetical protein [Leptolyngbya ohadii]